VNFFAILTSPQPALVLTSYSELAPRGDMSLGGERRGHQQPTIDGVGAFILHRGMVVFTNQLIRFRPTLMSFK
jgi:hypothetical protein